MASISDYTNGANAAMQAYLNAIMQHVGSTPTPFEQLHPFSDYYNKDQDFQSVTNQFEPYYQALLNNYYNINNLKNQNENNIYNTSRNYINQAQQNYLNYHNNRIGYDAAKLQGGFQGQGTGSSSIATGAGNDFANNNLYDYSQQQLSNQRDLQNTQNAFNYNTGLNNLDRQQYGFQQNQQRQKDVLGQTSQDYSNALQQYNTMKNNYYQNNNYTKF